MKFTPQIYWALALIILGLILVVGGFVLKLNDYSDGWITGNNCIILGMLVELLGIFIVADQFTKNLKK
ncbi:MAG TPA: hypothetical protein VL022_01215 [Moheibacter sp.]|nr:hypothetical protein [Moheibacter sp.]